MGPRYEMINHAMIQPIQLAKQLGLGRVYRQSRERVADLQERWYARQRSEFEDDRSFIAATVRFPERNALYRSMVHYYRHHLPPRLREHRIYFAQNHRGFGENAFHAMWWILLRELKPQ